MGKPNYEVEKDIDKVESVTGNSNPFTFKFSEHGMFLVIVHTSSNNACAMYVVDNRDNALYYTAIKTSNYITLTFNEKVLTISGTYSITTRILKL